MAVSTGSPAIHSIPAYVDEARPPFEDDIIRYYGQYVALVIADTFEAASAAAAAVKVGYETSTHDVSTTLTLSIDVELKVESERGDAASAFDSAPVKLDESYVTPVETHNPIKLHETVANWDGDSYTFYETS